MRFEDWRRNSFCTITVGDNQYGAYIDEQGNLVRSGLTR